MDPMNIQAQRDLAFAYQREGSPEQTHLAFKIFETLASKDPGNFLARRDLALAYDRAGTMQAGAYCFRPPMVKHGPYGSRSGAVILFRSLGGGQETFWDDAPPFTFTPEHAPFLPERLREAGAPFPRPPRY